jgi:tripartite-type tricarboxylate transporter receptor subunit TctC
MGAVHHSIAAVVYKKLPYDFLKDLRPITVLAIVPNVMVTRTEFPANSVAEVIALEKRNPGQFTYGSTGAGTAHHLIGEQFNDMAGTQLRHVPYKGSAPALVDLLGGRTDFMFDTVASCLPQIRSGKLKALAVATAKRSSILPGVPTLSEAGLTGFDIATWFGLMAPSATPDAVIKKIYGDVMTIMARAEFKKQLESIGAEPVGNTPEQMEAQIRSEMARFRALAEKAKLSLD